jgi:hypothetical protein
VKAVITFVDGSTSSVEITGPEDADEMTRLVDD